MYALKPDHPTGSCSMRGFNNVTVFVHSLCRLRDGRLTAHGALKSLVPIQETRRTLALCKSFPNSSRATARRRSGGVCRAIPPGGWFARRT
jgi:hypothetical protein